MLKHKQQTRARLNDGPHWWVWAEKCIKPGCSIHFHKYGLAVLRLSLRPGSNSVRWCLNG
jgi:hypothetical protein